MADFWVVPRVGNRWAAKAAGPAQSGSLHASRHAAREEAARLCAASGGGRVYVLGRRGRLEATETITVTTTVAGPPGRG